MNFEDARWTAGGLRFWKDVSDGTLDAACRGRHLRRTRRNAGRRGGRHLHRMSCGDQFHRPS